MYAVHQRSGRMAALLLEFGAEAEARAAPERASRPGKMKRRKARRKGSPEARPCRKPFLSRPALNAAGQPRVAPSLR